MTPHSHWIGAILALALLSPARAETPPDLRLAGDAGRAGEVWGQFARWLGAYERGEVEAVMAIFARDVVFSFQGSKDQDYEDLRAAYVMDFRSRTTGTRWVPHVEEVYADGSLAFVRATWELVATAADGREEIRARNRSLDVLRADKDGWRIFRSVNYPEPRPVGRPP
jgi:uncharacterized protein (TIGR02246 family)